MEHETHDYVPERGYCIGPRLSEGERPWPWDWEQNHETDNGHEHHWQIVVIQKHTQDPESVVRCMICLSPRCGDSKDRDPCMQRRHHRTFHNPLHGYPYPVGGKKA